MVQINRTRTLAILGAVALLGIPLVAAALDGTSNGANKTSAAGSTVEFLGNDTVGEEVLATSIKTSAPQDLLFSVSMECALWTTIATVGNDVSEAHAKITVSVLFDGVAVPISGD